MVGAPIRQTFDRIAVLVDLAVMKVSLKDAQR